MTIIKIHFEVLLVTSKKQENALSSQKVGYIQGQFTHICQLNVSYGQDSVSGIVHKLNETRNKVHLMKNNEI
jgi:hypothetical protein